MNFEALGACLADRYRIERELGQGGMATVYLAEDLKHKRKVALKVLKPELAAVLGAERFVQEITTTAALQHPHILPLFDSGEAGGFLYYVMPFIDGETLRAKLDRDTQLGIEESVRIASDVASALHYAHEHGVIHRDIKPENILLHDGRPMVADFGIALAVSAAAGGRMTETGLSLGTPHYMSPEQATAEKEITARSDVYSLGSVLYEMLTGEPPHMGNSAQQIIMKIITEDAAAVTRFRKAVPANVAAAVAKSLEKLPADRFESAKAFAEALGNTGFAHGGSSGAGAPAGAMGGRLRDPVFLGLAAIAVIGIGAAVWGRGGATPPADPSIAFQIVATGDAAPSFEQRTTTPLAISPDGARIVYSANRGSQGILVVRELGSFESRVLTGTEGATDRVFSPDGRSIAFRSGNSLMRVDLDGSAPVRIATLDRLNALYGLLWTPGDTLYYLSEGARAVFKLAMDGRSSSEAFPVPDSIVGTLADLNAVPGTEWLLTSELVVGDVTGRAIAFSTRTHEFRVLDLQGVSPRVLPGGTAVLLTKPGGVMTLTAFDSKRLVPTGPEVVVLDGVSGALSQRPVFALANNGTAVYVTTNVPNRILVEVTRDGRVTPILAEPGPYKDPRWSPDGRRLAFEVVDGSLGDIWIYDRQSKTRSRLTNQSENFYPNWTRDGERVVFASRRAGSAGIWWQRVDGSAPAEALQPGADELLRFPHAITPDGRTLLFRINSAASGMDIMAMDLAPGSEPRDVMVGPANDGSPVISPDGRWLAYVSDATGQNEVYVTPWPSVGRRAQISAGGGEEAMWNPRGGELFYRTGAALVAATLTERGGLLESVRRDTLFTGNYFGQPRWPQYDITADGSRFVMVQLGDTNAELRVMTHFDAMALRRLAARDRVE